MSVNFNSNTNDLRINSSFDNNEISNIDDDLNNSTFDFSPDTTSCDCNINNLSDDNIELIKEELERKVTELKQELENSQNTRGWATSLRDSITSLLGGGDKGKQNKISEYEQLLVGLEDNTENILSVYQTIMGDELTNETSSTLQTSENIAINLDSDEQNEIVTELENQLLEIENEFKTAQNSNGWISRAWNSFKNWTGIGASSNKTSAEIDELKEQLESLKNGEADLATTYKNITGNDLTIDNLNSFLNRETTLTEISKAGESLDNYKEGQQMVVDTVADITSGIISVGTVAVCSAVGICAAPFTAGASLGMIATGLGIAAGIGAAVKVAIKSSDCIGNEKTYSMTDLGYDVLTGAVNGAMGVFSNGVGSTVGKGIMKVAGMEALETTAKRTFAQSAIKVAASAADMAIDGALSGMTDSATRDIGENVFYDEDHTINEIVSDSATGFVGGLIASPIIGGGMKAAGKIGSEIGSDVAESVIGKASKEITGELSDTVLGQATKEAKETLSENFYKFANDVSDTKTANLLNLWGKVEIGDELVDSDFVAKLIDGVDIDAQESVLSNYTKLRAAGMDIGDEIIDSSKLDDEAVDSLCNKIKEDKINEIYSKIRKLLGIEETYNKAKSAMLNVPTSENPDMKLAEDFVDIYRQAKELLENLENKGENIYGTIDTSLTTISEQINGIYTATSSINSEISSISAENRVMIVKILEDISQGKDPSSKIYELAQKGISVTTLVSSSELAQEAADKAKIIPETATYKQLGDLPDRVKELYGSVYSEAQKTDELYQSAIEKINSGDIETGIKLMQEYCDALDEFSVYLDDEVTAVQTAAAGSGILDSADIIKNRLEKLMSSEDFQNMPREKQIQAAVENTNILLAKFSQTFSSDDSLPSDVTDILKQFTSDGIQTRTLSEAQSFADELYGEGKYTLKKSFGAGTIGETYLAETDDGTEVVIKMLKDGINSERFEEDRALFTRYIEEFVTDEADKEYKLNLINSMFDAWESELDYELEAQGAKNMAEGATRFNVAQTLEVGATVDGSNVSLVMEKAQGVQLDKLLEMIELYKENPDEYFTKYADEIAEFPALSTPENWYDALGEAYQKAQNEQSMFVTSSGTRTIHADPHAGNVYINFNSETGMPGIVYIDTGNTITRTSSETLQDITLTLNMMIGNSEGIAQSMLKGATLPDGADADEIAKQFTQMLDERLYKAGVSLKSTSYTQNTINSIMKKLNVIPDSGNSNLMKATLQRIETSRGIYAVCGTSSNKLIDISDIGKGIAKSLKSNTSETISTITPIIKWAYKNKNQALLTFFQMIIKNVS